MKRIALTLLVSLALVGCNGTCHINCPPTTVINGHVTPLIGESIDNMFGFSKCEYHDSTSILTHDDWYASFSVSASDSKK